VLGCGTLMDLPPSNDIGHPAKQTSTAATTPAQTYHPKCAAWAGLRH